MQQDFIDFKRKAGIKAADPTGMIFIKLPESRIELTGFPWFEQDRIFRRLPLQQSAILPSEVDRLANCTAGGKIRFRSNSRKIQLQIKRGILEPGDNMSPMGMGAFDLYAGSPGQEEFRGVLRAHPQEQDILTQIYSSADREMQTFSIYFPTYCSVGSIAIGIEEDAVLQAPEPFTGSSNGIVVYGSSIAQGASASRPGLNYINRLSRRLKRHCVNLGFSGAGKGEVEVAEVISQINDADLFILDFEPNTVSRYAQKLPDFIKVLRKTHKSVPILVVSRYPFTDYPINVKDIEETAAVLNNMHDPKLYFADASNIFGNNPGDYLADGIHATDEAFACMSSFLAPIIEDIFNT